MNRTQKNCEKVQIAIVHTYITQLQLHLATVVASNCRGGFGNHLSREGGRP